MFHSIIVLSTILYALSAWDGYISLDNVGMWVDYTKHT